jgi:ribosomal protein L37AE/L43A
MNNVSMKEIWLCSHCGHQVSESDEFCGACEFIFAGTELAARSRFGKRIVEAGIMKLECPQASEYFSE